jgi:hypothetical protein
MRLSLFPPPVPCQRNTYPTQPRAYPRPPPPPKVASKYLKDITKVHGTVFIYVGIGKGPGTGEERRCAAALCLY